MPQPARHRRQTARPWRDRRTSERPGEPVVALSYVFAASLRWARERPSGDDGLDDQRCPGSVGLRLRDCQDGGTTENCEDPIRRSDQPCGRPATWLNADVAEIRYREQQEAKPGTQEPNCIGRPGVIEQPGHSCVCRRNEREYAARQEVDDSEAGVDAVRHEWLPRAWAVSGRPAKGPAAALGRKQVRRRRRRPRCVPPEHARDWNATLLCIPR